MKCADIIGVEPGSLAEEIGLAIGDKIVKINHNEIGDLIRFQMEWAGEEVFLEVMKENGEKELYEIEKDYDEPLGAYFESAIFDGIKTCRNKCMFCFVDQMPPNMRPSLYIKDDDYRLSFLQGSFITLTNLEEKDIDRIMKEHLSPLYVSVHVTDPDIRRALMKNPKAGESLEIMKSLSREGIEFHTQAVLCPGINDGEILEKTYHDLSNIEGVISLAMVPVGLTAYRAGLSEIRTFTEKEARDLVEWVSHRQKQELKKRGSRFLWPSDEFYLLANKEIPSYEDYEDFIQLENGVGMVRLLWDGFEQIQLPVKLDHSRKIVFATGVSGYKAIKPVVDKLNEIEGLEIIVKTITNIFFGPSVTVTGLLTGKCLLEGLKNIEAESIVFIPENMVQSGNGKFLDDLTTDEIEKKLGIKLITVPVDADGILEKIMLYR